MSTTSFVGRRVPGQTVRVTKQPLRVPMPLTALWWLAKVLLRLLVRVGGSPVAVVTLTAMVGTWALCQLASPLIPFVGMVVIVGGLVAIRFRHPAAFDRCILQKLRSRWRAWSIYRRKWSATMDMAELNGHRKNGTQYEPVLLSVKSTPDLDRVRARMLAGQVVEDWGKVSDRLCQTFGAQDCRVRSVPGRPHEVEALFLINDPLREVIEPLEVGSSEKVTTTLAGLPVGLREDGQVYRLPLVGNHVLLDGATGSGKSSVLWAIVYQLAPAIADGTVEIWGIDPKAMELAAGDPLFARLAWAGPEDYAETLEDAVVVMRERQVSLRGVTRLHQPSRAEPLIVVMIDELAALAYTNDRDIKRRTENALALLLSQGRAVGVTVVGAIQDARKETLPARGLYTVRVVLRVNEADEVDLVFSRGARDRGARADKIPADLQGVAFVEVDGEPEPVRVRFAWVSDLDIAMLSTSWHRPLSLLPDPAPVEEAA